MQEFTIIYRRNLVDKRQQPTLDQLQDSIGKWQKWIRVLAAEGKLVYYPRMWDRAGQTLISAPTKKDNDLQQRSESMGGFLLIYAWSYEEAVIIAAGCPVFELGGCAEIRLTY